MSSIHYLPMCDSSGESPINMASILTPNVAQYLHPDYLQPLPTTLDAKKSPLALLAQTCSSIGKDPAPSKSLIPPLEKKEGEKGREKTPSATETRKSPSAEHSDSGRDSANKPGFRSVPPKEIPPLVPISSTSGSSSKKSSPAPASSRTERSGENTTVTTSVTRPVSSAGSSNHGNSNGSTRSTSSAPVERERERDLERDRHRDSGSEGRLPSRSSPDHPSSLSGSSKHHISSSHSHPSLHGLGPGGMSHSGLSMYGHGMALDPASASSVYASSLAAAHSGFNLTSSAAAALAAQNAALKQPGFSGLSPYVSYARVRTPSGATTLVPVCRDPFCTNCQLTLQNCHVSSTCTSPGCAQCAHEKSLQSLSALGMAGASLPGLLPQLSTPSSLPSLPSGLSSYPTLPSSLYAHSLLGSTTQGLPYVCNWVAGNDYCGKRFTTSEELLQHLRSHTSSADSSSLAGYGALGISPLGLSGYYHGPLPSHGGLSPNSLRRAYPTIPSPLSSVLNGSRYHPYKSPLPSVPSAVQPGQPLSSLAPYYSPYSLYGQRIGAAAVP